MSDYRDDEPSTLPAIRQQQSSLASAEQRKVVSEIQARVAFARHNPRDQMYATEQIERDCTRPRLAETAIYEYARGGTDISGPSIRLMETIARRWGNMASGIREVYRDTTEGYSECVAFAWDMESNYYDEREFVVRHWRDTKSGGYRLRDERDIYEMIANYGQRRKRACLIAVIPGDVVEAAVEQCERTLNTHVDMKPETITRLAEAFAEFGVTRKQIETRIQRKLDAIHPAQVVQLRKIYASLKDGMSEAAEWFPVETTKAWEEVQRRQAANVVPMPSRDEPPANGETQKKAAPKKTAAKKAAVNKGQETSERVNNSPERRMQADPPPPAAFEAYLLDPFSEPVEQDPITDAWLFLERMADLYTRTEPRLREGLLEANADSIEDARETVPEEEDALAQVQTEPPATSTDGSDQAQDGETNETREDNAIEVVVVKQENGKPDYPGYARALGEALTQAGPEMFLDVLAPQKPTIDGLPASARLLAIKAIASAAEKHDLEVPAEFRQARRAPPATETAPQSPPKDRDAEQCAAHCSEMERATTLDYLRSFATSTAVTTRYKRWQSERPELAQRMDEARIAAEQRLKAPGA